MENYYFRTEQMTVGYDGKPLIKDIDVGVRRGEILCLIGPNGSGKSTILKSITRQLAMISGVVYIGKDSLHNLSFKETSTKVSVVLTDRVNPEMMTCGDVVAAGRYPYTNHFGALTPKDILIVNESLDKVHAMDIKERDFGQISDGQRQRIMLARAICQQPEIIVLDEPTSFLDIRHKIEILDILRAMAREKRIAVILSLHEIDLVPKVADVVMCVKGETIESIGHPDEIFTEDNIRRLYDIEKGMYNMRFGSVELGRPVGEPQGMVIAGGGHGIAVYRELQKRQIAFSTGILYENDVDYEVARALSSHVVWERAFTPVRPETLQSAAALLGASRWVIDAGTPVRDYNKANGELLNRALSQGIPVWTKDNLKKNMDEVFKKQRSDSRAS